MKNFPLSGKPNELTGQTIDNVESFDTIYTRYSGKVYQKCLLMTNDTETAKDFTQDIFIKVFFKLNTFQNRSALSTWLYSIAHNYCLDQLRVSKRLATEALSDRMINEFTEPDQSVSAQWHALEYSLNDLPSQEAALLRLKYEDGLSIKAISERYEVSESAIKMRLLRTRDKLQELCTNHQLLLQ
ncbi:RNA polymerase sigma factor [Spirosoma areae]